MLAFAVILFLQVAAAAVTAVREWRFRPTLVSGQPVPVRTTLMVNFTLPK
jgi:outer membrane biosynthesis protein TonB